MIPPFLLQAVERDPAADAVVTAAGTSRYADLAGALTEWRVRLDRAGVSGGRVVSIEGDYSLDLIAALLAAIDLGCIVVPLSSDSEAHAADFLAIAEVEFRADCRARTIAKAPVTATHPLLAEIANRKKAGLVLFSSGSSGRHKAAIHDLEALLQKFAKLRHRYRTLIFLQADHIGGLNTLFYTLANGGSLIVAPDRSPESVAATIQRHRVQLLPTSPTFLNLLLMSGATERHDISTLELITYGTEPMPQSTLTRLNEALPGVRLLQTYGMTELGILRSQSRGPDSLWVRVGGEGYETRVVDGRLQVKAESAMLGYLNAPSPFTDDGFFETGDRVETSGDWLRILGRDSEIINVGGNKVYPAEVEDVLLQMTNVLDATVYGESNAITGQAVACTVRLAEPEPAAQFKLRLRQHCAPLMAAFKVPARVSVTADPLHSSRFKRLRRPADPAPSADRE